MLGTYASAGLVCVGALLLGQAVSAAWLLRDAAYRPPPVGILAGVPVEPRSAVTFLSPGHRGPLRGGARG